MRFAPLMRPLPFGNHILRIPMLDFSRNHFDLFALPMAYAIDSDRLDQAYRGIQAEIHPDKFAHAGDAEQRLAMQWSTRVNEAYQTLRKPFERARYLLELNGIDAMDAKNTSMPADFLMQQIEWREALMDARSGKDIAALQALENELKAQAKSLQTQLASLLDAQKNYAEAGNVLRKVRFMDKLLAEIDATYEEIE
jgi:molecular chaperone HscB